MDFKYKYLKYKKKYLELKKLEQVGGKRKEKKEIIQLKKEEKNAYNTAKYWNEKAKQAKLKEIINLWKVEKYDKEYKDLDELLDSIDYDDTDLEQPNTPNSSSKVKIKEIEKDRKMILKYIQEFDERADYIGFMALNAKEYYTRNKDFNSNSTWMDIFGYEIYYNESIGKHTLEYLLKYEKDLKKNGFEMVIYDGLIGHQCYEKKGELVRVKFDGFYSFPNWEEVRKIFKEQKISGLITCKSHIFEFFFLGEYKNSIRGINKSSYFNYNKKNSNKLKKLLKKHYKLIKPNKRYQNDFNIKIPDKISKKDYIYFIEKVKEVIKKNHNNKKKLNKKQLEIKLEF